MLKTLLDWVRNLLRRSGSPAPPHDDAPAEPEPEPPPLDVEFVNLTSFDVVLCLVASEASDETLRRMATLVRGSSHVQETAEGTWWVVREPASGLELVRVEATEPDQLVEIDESAVRADHDLVTVVFRNSTAFGADLYRIGTDGQEELVSSCPAGTYLRSPDADPTTPWRIRTREHGALLRSYLPTTEPVQHCEIENTLIGFENTSYADVDVLRVEASGATTPIAGLAPQEFVVVANYAAWPWTVVERGSRREVARVPATTEPVTVAIGEQRLGEPSTGDEVEVSLRNGNQFAVVVERIVAADRAETITTLAPDGLVTVTARPGTAWRFRESFTSDEVGLYVADASPTQEHRTRFRSTAGRVPSLGEFVNETPLTLERVWLDYGDGEQPYGLVPPHTDRENPSYVTHKWALRERHSGTIVATSAIERETPVTRVLPSSIHGVDGGAPVGVVLENATPFRVDALTIDVHGGRHANGHIDPDESRDVRTTSGSAWEFRKHVSGELVGMFIANTDAEQRYVARIASVSSTTPTTIDLVNRTPLTIDVHWVDLEGEEMPATHALGRGDVVTLDTFVGSSWVARDRHSGEVLGAAIGRKVPQTVDLTSEHLRSLNRRTRVRVVLANTTHLDAEVFWIDEEAALVSYGSISPGGQMAIDTYATHPWRIRSAAFDAEIGLFIPDGSPEQRYEITTDFVRTTPGARPNVGEVALYEQAQYGGRVWILDATVFDLGAVPGLSRVGSVRVGPSTGVTLCGDPQLGGVTHDLYMDVPTLDGTPFADGDVASLRLWRVFTPKEAGISSRSTLVEDRRVGAGGAIETFLNYRTIITLPRSVTEVDLSASEPMTLDVGGTTHVHDGHTPVRLHPNAMSRLVVNIEAQALSAPTLFVRTNTMPADAGARVLIFPDAPAHHNISRLQPGALHAAQGQLGIAAPLTAEQSSHLQTAVMNLAGTVQYTYHPSPHGVHHKRQISAANMEHPHWTIGLDGAAPEYRPLRHDEVLPLIRHARQLDAAAGQSILGFIEDVGRITVHTVSNVGHDVVETGKHVVGDIEKTGENVGRHVVQTVHHVGEDLKNGDVVGAMGDVRDGTLSVGHDLASGALHVGGDISAGAAKVAGDVAAGAAKLVVVTVHFAEEAVQFVLDHTGVVGELIGKILEKIGAAIEKFIAWIAAQLGWDDVLHTQRVLAGAADQGIADLEQWLAGLEQEVDGFFASMEDDVRTELARVLPRASAPARARHRALAAEWSESIEKIEWFLSLVADHESSSPTPPAMDLSGPAIDASLASFAASVTEVLGPDGAHLDDALADVLADLQELFGDPHASPDDILLALTDIVTVAAETSLELANGLADAAIQLLEAILRGVQGAFSHPLEIPLLEDLFSAVTGGEPLTIENATTLVIALPTTLYVKAVEDRAPFADVATAGQLLDLREPVRDWGYVYGILHVIQGLVATIADSVRAADELAKLESGEAPQGDVEMTSASDWHASPRPVSGPNVELTSLGNASAPRRSLSALSVVEVLLGLFEQISGNPTEQPTKFPLPDFTAAGDADRAPSHFWGPVIWYFQWAVWTAELLASGIGTVAALRRPSEINTAMDTFMTYARPIIGIIHCGGMIGLTIADNTRAAHLAGKAHPTKDEDNFVAWHDQHGVAAKALTNVMDTVPEIGQLGFVPKVITTTEGISAVVAALLDDTGHETEGIVFIARTRAKGLL